MAPVIRALRKEPLIDTVLCSTGQHREMFKSVLDTFSLTVDVNLNVMVDGQSLVSLAGRMFQALDDVFKVRKPDLVLVHGDTATTLAGALVSYYTRIPIMHVEAGLRTKDLYSPWPEEGNRRITGTIANFHFAPTLEAAMNLKNEGIDDSQVMVTGNTVIDALLMTRDALANRSSNSNAKESDSNLILVTCHRRENLGANFKSICRAINLIAKREDVSIVFPLHLNPLVRDQAYEYIEKADNVSLIEPLEYQEFVHLMLSAKIILTDSGGIQEEAPSINKPVLVLRDTTERPEVIDIGAGLLVGTDTKAIVTAVNKLLDDQKAYNAMINKVNPYGDGLAAERIASHVLDYLEV